VDRPGRDAAEAVGGGAARRECILLSFALGAQPGGTGEGRFAGDVLMEEVARKGLGSEGCDGGRQAVAQRRPLGRVVPCVFAGGGDVDAELVPIGDAAANGGGEDGHVGLCGAGDGMGDRACERAVQRRGVGGRGGRETAAVWSEAVSPSEVERAAVLARVQI